MARSLEIQIRDGFGQLRSDTDSESIEPAVAAGPRPLRLQFDEPLPDPVLAATAAAIRDHPELVLRAYGRQVDPSLEWLSGSEHTHHLVLHLWHVTSFDKLAGFRQLRSLGLGETASKRPSLGFLRELSHLSVLRLEDHDKDFDAVGDIPNLTRLYLRVPRAKSLECLRGHASLEIFWMNFGGIRDLSPLAELPRLRGLELYQIRKLGTEDIDALGDCGSLEAVSLGALRNVDSLRALAHKPRLSLRLLILEGLTGLTSLEDLAACAQLEQLGLYESRPADKRLDVLLRCASLKHLVVDSVYPRDQIKLMSDQFQGATLQLRGAPRRGDLADVAVRWRAPVHRYLDGEP